MRRFSAGIVAFIIFVACGAASAQVWLEDRASKEGPGIKLGDSLVLHLGMGLEGGYDTNALYGSNAQGAGRLRLAPYVDLATRNKRRLKDEGVLDETPPTVKFRLGVAAFYDHYFPTSDSSETTVKNLNGRNGIGIDTHGSLEVFPERNFTFLMDLAYLRTTSPYETSADAISRHDLSPGIGFRLRPGGGTLSFELGYRLNFLKWEDSAVATDNDKHSHDVRLWTSWKVFPKTSLVSRVNFAPIIYYGDGAFNKNSMPIRSLFGLQGLVTDRFGLLLLAGYGASFYDSGPNFDSVLAQGELMFFVTPFSNIRLGGQRDFVDSMYANFYVKNGGYLSYEQMFGGVFLATLRGEVFYRSYATLDEPLPNGSEPNYTDRKDVWASGSLLLEFRITDWLSLHGSAEFLGDFTDFGYEDPQGNTYGMDFSKFIFFGGVRAHY